MFVIMKCKVVSVAVICLLLLTQQTQCRPQYKREKGLLDHISSANNNKDGYSGGYRELSKQDPKNNYSVSGGVRVYESKNKKHSFGLGGSYSKNSGKSNYGIGAGYSFKFGK